MTRGMPGREQNGIIPVRIVSWQWTRSSGDAKNWLDILYISKVDQTEFANRYEKEELSTI